MSPGHDPLIGRVLGGRYRVDRPLGAGGMGAVLAGVELPGERPVALKTLLEPTDPRDVERLWTEAFAAASLAHPNIVKVTDFLPATGADPPCIVMELLEGRSLHRVLAERGALPVPVALHVVRQILDALAAAHAAGIVHRDVKPANVMVLAGSDPERPSIKVVDFGIAKLMDDGSRHTATGTVLGTPSYMAPEQHLALPPTPAVDVWAVSVCLYEMLAGRRLFTGPIGDVFTQVTRGAPPDLAAVAPHVPSFVVVAVARGLSRAPQDRFGDAAAMRAALSPAPPPATDEPAGSHARTFVLSMTLALVAASLVAGATLILARRAAPRSEQPMAAADVAPPSAEVAGVADAEADDATGDAGGEASEDDAAPPPAASSPARSPKREPCVCMDGWVPLCPTRVYECECRGGVGMICFVDWPDGKCGGRDRLVSKTPRDGEPCTGFRRLSSGAREWSEPADGKLACFEGCIPARAQAIAVAGTPCSGHFGDERRTGKWLRRGR